MSENTRSDAFEEACNAFRQLSTEEKATFLVETVTGAVVSGLEEASEAVLDAVRRACEPCRAQEQERDAEDPQDKES